MSKESNTLEKISGIELVQESEETAAPGSEETTAPGSELTERERRKRKRYIDRMWRRDGRKQERERKRLQKKEEEAKKADKEAWTKSALPELTKWNQEFIKNYAPGTANAKRIAPLISAFPQDIYQEMKDKSPEEKYQWFYENNFKRLMTLNIPGQTGRLNFEWKPEIQDEHGARGLFMGGENFPGIWLMQLDPNYWFRATPEKRKDLLFHELEHALSSTIGSHQRGNMVREKEEERDLWSNYTDSSASNITEQVAHYDEVFSILNIPKWLDDLIEEGATLTPNTPIETIVPINFAWANRRDEQRSVLKTFLSKHGGVMTPELLNGLCKERERAGTFDWKNSSLDQKLAFLRTFQDKGFRLDVLLYLNCTDKDKVLNHINSIVVDTNALGDTPEEQRVMTASVDNELTTLHKALVNQGFEKEAEEVKLLIKSATHNR